MDAGGWEKTVCASLGRHSWCGVILRKRTNAGGSVSWQLDYGVVEGRRKRVAFEDREEAERALVAAREAQRRLGALGVAASPVEMAEFLAARERLAKAGASILEAVEFFMAHGLKVSRPKLLTEVIEDFIWSREELGRDQRTLETYRHVLRSLGRSFPSRQAHELTRDDVRAWRRSQGWSASTQNKALGHVRSLFKWAVSERHAGHDPCEGIEEVTAMPQEIEVLSVGECEQLLRYALEVPRFMPFVVLAMFRGMRRAELERLRFEELDAKAGTVIAAARKVKTRQRRVVELTPQMLAWIRAAGWTEERMQTGPVAPANLKTLWPRFWQAAGLRRWPHNGLRHTFASMHYAMHEDEAKLQAILGQRSAEVLHTNYRALKTKAEARRFFALRPPEGR
ncbi:MAG: Tyrosine recombinase XerC [Elusimicrobia bacterium]|nr:Tyrosine recombinase XerC [Elusimicrobiota bacterium]